MTRSRDLARAPRAEDWEDGPDAPEDARIAGPRWTWPEGAIVLLSGDGLRPLALLAAAGSGPECESAEWPE